MLFGISLFAHFAGLSLWIGALLFSTIVFILVKSHVNGTNEIRELAQRIARIAMRISHLGAFLVLISGVYMILDLNIKDKPFWLSIMEKGGGSVIIISIILTGIVGSRTIRRMSNLEDRSVKISGFVRSSALSLVLIAAVLFIVSMKY
ncbi:hypothetical protein [Paenibacillus sp. GCM10027626]|uniref:hypothetical protein n=1 Tax=Paenibacillus sp. GCM10027626 TaxID=3273411 RepID=UPI0036400CE1